MNNRLREDIITADSIIMKGFKPNTKLLGYFDKPKAFIGYDHVFYGMNQPIGSETYNVVRFLHQTGTEVISHYFSAFYHYSEKTRDVFVFRYFSEFYAYHIARLRNTLIELMV